MNECLKWGRRFPTWSLFTLKASYLVEWLFSGWSFMLLCLLIAQNMKVSPVPCTNPKWTMRVTSMEKHKVEVNHPGCCTEMGIPWKLPHETVWVIFALLRDINQRFWSFLGWWWNNTSLVVKESFKAGSHFDISISISRHTQTQYDIDN